MTRLLWLMVFFAASAHATKPTEAPKPEQSQTQNQSQTAYGGNGGIGTGGSAAGGAASSWNEMTTVGIANTAPVPLHATPACYLPAKGIRRVRQALFGVVTLDSRLVRDADCMADLAAEREYKLKMLEAEANLERFRAARITAERQSVEAVSK